MFLANFPVICPETYPRASKNFKQSQMKSLRCSNGSTTLPSEDSPSQDLPKLIKDKLLLYSCYPSSYNYTNPFCPLCLCFVTHETRFIQCQLTLQKNYLIHEECLVPQFEDAVLPVRLEELSETKPPSKQFLGVDPEHTSREYIVELSMQHPVSLVCFMKTQRKCSLANGELRLVFKDEETDSFLPNVVCLPMIDFNITVLLRQMHSGKAAVSINQYFKVSDKNPAGELCMKSKQISLQLIIVRKPNEQARLIDLMNYKYKFQTVDDLPLLQLSAVTILLPASKSENKVSITRSMSLGIDRPETDSTPASIEAIRMSQSPGSFQTPSVCNYFPSIQTPLLLRNFTSFTPYDPSMMDSHALRSENAPACMVGSSFKEPPRNLQYSIGKMISSGDLGEYVKSKLQSKHMQNYLHSAPKKEIERICESLLGCFPELVAHEYGNYTAQKLFKVCNPDLRFRLLLRISQDIPTLICNKQGTHTLQAFVRFFGCQQEFAIICAQLKHDFYNLSKHNNATHFIQKIMVVFPLSQTEEFFHYVADNLVHFALDKNAMCVIKHMMYKLREELNYKGAFILRDKFIARIGQNISDLLQDGYGNYVVQFCYQLGTYEECSTLTRYVINNFSGLANGRYSSNLLLKCLTSFWLHSAAVDQLHLTTEELGSLYGNKEGNKTLLSLIEHYPSSLVCRSMREILRQFPCSKYCHRKWMSYFDELSQSRSQKQLSCGGFRQKLF